MPASGGTRMCLHFPKELDPLWLCVIQKLIPSGMYESYTLGKGPRIQIQTLGRLRCCSKTEMIYEYASASESTQRGHTCFSLLNLSPDHLERRKVNWLSVHMFYVTSGSLHMCVSYDLSVCDTQPCYWLNMQTGQAGSDGLQHPGRRNVQI